MDTRLQLDGDSRSHGRLCVYCGGKADTNYHAPPRCFMRRPLPSNLLTFPACKACNSGLSFHENAVQTFIVLISSHPDHVAERQPDGRVGRALARDSRLRSIIEAASRSDGNYELGIGKGVRYLYFTFFGGRPRGRVVISRPNSDDAFVNQVSSPNGVPRFTLLRIALSSSSVCGSFTWLNQPEERRIGQLESSDCYSVVP